MEGGNRRTECRCTSIVLLIPALRYLSHKCVCYLPEFNTPKPGPEGWCFIIKMLHHIFRFSSSHPSATDQPSTVRPLRHFLSLVLRRNRISDLLPCPVHVLSAYAPSILDITVHGVRSGIISAGVGRFFHSSKSKLYKQPGTTTFWFAVLVEWQRF